MKKFALCIDKKGAYGLEFMSFEAADLTEAIEMADELWNDKIYLMKIMEKTGKTERSEGYKVETYTAILCRRSHGWHLNNTKNSEGELIAQRMTRKDIEFFEVK